MQIQNICYLHKLKTSKYRTKIVRNRETHDISNPNQSQSNVDDLEILNFNKYDPGEQGQARDRCFIAASREFEFSYEDLESQYSVLTKVLLKGIDPNRCPQQWITNYSLIDFINQNLGNENQRPVFSNFGSPINLTRTLDTKTPELTGQGTGDIRPYKGLEYFDCNDEDPKYFYGREELTDKLLA
jgi:hypothetical protein